MCCPKNYTEKFCKHTGNLHVLACEFDRCSERSLVVMADFDTPRAYASHPPVFLAQTSPTDAHADACATRHYHETLKANGSFTCNQEIYDRTSEMDCS